MTDTNIIDTATTDAVAPAAVDPTVTPTSEATVETVAVAVAATVTTVATAEGSDARKEAIAAAWKKVKSVQKKFNVSDEEFLANAPVPKAKKEKVAKVKVPKAPKEPKVKKEKVAKAPKAPKEPKLNADGTPKKAHSLKGTHIEAKYMVDGKPWSGRGLMPKAMTEAIAKDPTLTKASFLIK